MTLSDYMVEHGLTDEKFGEMAKKDRTTISRWRRGVTKVEPGHECFEIERITSGAVTRHDLRPDIYPPEEAAA